MFDTKFINDMAKRFSDMLPPSLQNVKTDLEKNLHSLLQSTFAKLDLVTRDEFEAQAGVLAKTRTKVEILEQQVAALEQVLASNQAKFPPHN